jgi:hypothetical protein
MRGRRSGFREALMQLRKGIQGERDAAYFLDQYFRESKNNAVLHDLRLVVDGDVAQIDHLIINRVGGFFLIETKNYSGSVKINAYGEFAVDYDGEIFGIPSPVEQSRRHERVLCRVLDRLEIKNRIGTAFQFHHVVLFHPKAVITRPLPSELDTSCVMKADQFPSWHERYVDKEPGVREALLGLANVVSADTVREWGEKLARQHRPINQIELPDFIRPKEQAPVHIEPIKVKASPLPASQFSSPSTPERRLVCLHCTNKISFAEGKFCWSNEARFKGGQYCREHQALF